MHAELESIEQGPERPPGICGVHHVKLPVRDPAISRDWYVRVLGFKQEVEFVEEGGSSPESSVKAHLADSGSKCSFLYLLSLECLPNHAVVSSHRCGRRRRRLPNGVQEREDNAQRRLLLGAPEAMAAPRDGPVP